MRKNVPTYTFVPSRAKRTTFGKLIAEACRRSLSCLCIVRCRAPRCHSRRYMPLNIATRCDTRRDLPPRPEIRGPIIISAKRKDRWREREREGKRRNASEPRERIVPQPREEKYFAFPGLIFRFPCLSRYRSTRVCALGLSGCTWTRCKAISHREARERHALRASRVPHVRTRVME